MLFYFVDKNLIPGEHKVLAVEFNSESVIDQKLSN